MLVFTWIYVHSTTYVYRYHQPVVYMSSEPVHVDLLSFTYQRQIRQTGGTYVCSMYPCGCACVCMYVQYTYRILLFVRGEKVSR